MDDSKTRLIIGSMRLEPVEARPAGPDVGRRRLRVVVNEPDVSAALDGYLAAIARFDTMHAWRIATELAEQVAPRAWLFDFVLPALQARPEALVSAQLRACLLARQHALTPRVASPRLMAAAPAGQRDELTLLAAALLALANGFEVIYLGVDLSDAQLAWCARACRPEVLLSIGAGPALPGIETLVLADGSQATLAACDDALAGLRIRR